MDESLRRKLQALDPDQRARLLERLAARKAQKAAAPALWAHPATERFWFLEGLNPGHPAHLIAGWLHLAGPLDLAALHRALGELLERHPALRTRLEAVDGRPQFRTDPVGAARPAPRGRPPAMDADTWIESVVTRLGDEPFRLAEEPPVRFELLQLEPEEHALVFVVHHAMADGHSMQLLFEELAALYGHARDPDRLPPPAPSVTLATLAAQQRTWLTSPEAQSQAAWWSQHLAGAPELELPFDHPRRERFGRAGARRAARWDADLTRRLDDLGRAESATPFVVLLAVSYASLARVTGQRDLVLGTPFSARTSAASQRVFGLLVNSLALRVQWEEAPSFRDLLREARRVALDAFERASLPFERVVDELRLPRQLERNPVFSAMLNYAEEEEAAIEAGGLHWAPMLAPRGSLLDLTIYARRRGARLDLEIEYDTSLFEAATIQRLLDTLQAVAQAATSAPDLAIEDLILVDAARVHAIAALGRGPADSGTAASSLAREVLAAAAKFGAAVAWRDAHEAIAYSEIGAELERHAAALARAGVVAGDRVGIDLDRSARLPIWLLAVQRLGAAWVAFDGELPATRLDAMIARCAPRFVLVDANTRAAWNERGDEVRDAAQLLRDTPLGEAATPADQDSSAPAYILHTSGSTGIPKAVVVPQSAIVGFLRSMAIEPGFSRGDRLLAATHLGFDIAQLELFAPLLGGAEVEIAPLALARDALALRARLEDPAITVFQATPTTHRMLRGVGFRPRAGLRLLIGGEALPQDLAAELLEGGAAVWNLYGPTETTVWSALSQVAAGEAVAIGRPIHETLCVVIDAARRPVPLGSAGELWIGGRGVAAGYLADDERTSAAFVELAGHPEWGRGYRTGDRVRWDGRDRLRFLGRIDDQLKVRGHRVEPGEIELALREEDAVLDAHVGPPLGAEGAHAAAAAEELIAWVQVDPRAAESDSWREVWSQTYAEAGADPERDLAGWRASGAGPELDAAVMAAWLEVTIDRLRALAPRRVLELGTGTGLVLFRLAAGCERWVGFDLVPEVAARVQSQIAVRGWEHVQVAPADFRELDLPAEDRFDTIILNSVVQYLGSEEELIAIIDGLMPFLDVGGRIFLGDLRDRDRLALLHYELLQELSEAQRDPEIVTRVHARVRAENELCLAPRWFARLRERVPAMAVERLEAKPGEGRDELTRFRYDAVLVKERPVLGAAIELRAGVDVASLDHLAEVLPSWSGQSVIVRGFADPRVLEVATRWQAAQGAVIQDSPPWDWRASARSHLGVVRPLVVAPSLEGDPGTVDLLIGALGAESAPAPLSLDFVDRATEPAATHPQRTSLEALLPERLRTAMRTRLPEAWRPARYVFVDGLPRLTSGKIDRSALPIPAAREQAVRDDQFRTEAERTIAATMAQILDERAVGPEDDFFALGGHSLLATRLALRIEEALGMAVPIRAIFRSATPRTLAKRLLADHAEQAPRTAAIQRLAPGAPQPLSFAEERLLFLEEMLEGKPVYAMPLAARMQGRFDATKWRAAFGALRERHPVLKTIFPAEKGRRAWRQVVDRPLPLKESDLAAGKEQTWIDAVIARPFDPAHEPPWRVAIAHLGAEEHLFVLVLHHVLGDARSLVVLAADAAQLLAGEDPADLPPVPLDVADFAAWQRQLAHDGHFDDAAGWWRSHLSSWPKRIAWPRRRPRPLRPSWEGGRLAFALDSEESLGVDAAARRLGVTSFAFWMAGLALLLERLGAGPRALIGTTSSERADARLDGAMGLFANLLPLAIDLEEVASFGQLAHRVQAELAAALEHGGLPFERLVASLDLPRDPATPPLVQATFDRVTLPAWPAQIGPLRVEGIDVHPGTARFELSWRQLLTPDGEIMEVEWARDLFDESTIRAWWQAWRGIVARASEDANRGCEALLTRELAGENPESDPELAPHLPAVLERVRRTQAKELALQTADGQSHRFEDLDRRIATWRQGLREAEIARGDLVAVALPRGVDLAAALLAVWEQGAAWLPLDAGHPPRRLAQLMGRAGVRAFMAADRLASELNAAGPWARIEATPSTAAASAPVARVNADDLAYLIFTSGSTGEPKGVRVSHGAIAFYARHAATTYPYRAGGPSAWHTSIAADLGLTSWLPAWTVGAPVQMLEEAPGIDPLLDALQEGAAFSVVKLTPTHLRALAAGGARAEGGRFAAALVIGGEALPAALLRPWRVPGGPRLFNEYGPTEATVGCIVHEIDREGPAEPPSIGLPFAGVRALVLDEQGRVPLAGAEGELFLSGPGLALGYLDEEHEAGAFVVDHHPAASGRWYRTGDLVIRDPSGSFHFVGRKDAQVKVRGFRVEPEEVRSSIAKAEGVEDAVVLVRAREDGSISLEAHVVLRGDLELADLQVATQRELPPALRPSRWRQHAAIPRAATGKLDEAALIQAGDRQTAAVAAETRTSSSPHDLQPFLSAFAQVLNVDRVEPDDDFFALGGDSILALEVVARLRDAGWMMRARDLFDQPTSAGLAQVAHPITATAGETAIARFGVAPVLPMQRWWLSRTWAEPSQWNQDLVLRVRAPLTAERAHEVVAKLVEHHEALRARFTQLDGDWAVELSANAEGDLPWSEHAAESEVELLDVRSQVDARIDFEAGILFAAGWATSAAGERWLVLAAHHLIVDGVSWRVLVGDLLREIQGTALAPAPALLAMHHAVEATLRGAVLPPAEDSPTVTPGERVSELRTVTIAQDLEWDSPSAPRDAWEPLLIAALGQGVAELWDRDSVRIDVEGHGRDLQLVGAAATPLDLGSAVGWFTQLLPIEVRHPRRSSGDEALRVALALSRAAEERGADFLRRMAAESDGSTVAFNLLGSAGAEARGGPLEPVLLDAPASRGTANLRPWAIEVDALPTARGLKLVWRIDDRIDPSQVVALSEALREALLSPAVPARTLIHAKRVTTVGLSPDDLGALLHDEPELTGAFPLSATQAGMVYHGRLEPSSRAYFEQMAVRLAGPLDEARLRRSLGEVQRRHPLLRSRVGMLDRGDPVLIQTAAAATSLVRVDLDEAAQADPDRALEEWLTSDRQQGIDLGTGMPWRLHLLRWDAQHHALVLTWHHLILDGWSLMIVLRDLARVYAGEALDAQPRRSAWADHLRAEARARGREARTFWRQRLAGFELATPLPWVDAAIPSTASDEDGEIEWAMPADRSQGLRDLASRARVTLSTVVQAAWAIFLARHSASSEVLFGLTVAGRDEDDPRSAADVGLFINTLPRRIAIEEDAILESWLQTIQSALREEMRFDRTPLPLAQGSSDVPPGEPIFESIVVFENYPIDEALRSGFGDLRPVATRGFERTSYGLTLVVVPGESIVFRWLGDERWPGEEAADGLIARWSQLLGSMIEGQSKQVRDLDLWSSGDRDRVRTWAQAKEPPTESPADLVWSQRLLAWGRKPALVVEDATWSYADLGQRVADARNALAREGIGEGSSVALDATPHAAAIVLLLALWDLGAAWVPIASEWPHARKSDLLRRVGVDGWAATGSVPCPDGARELDWRRAASDEGAPGAPQALAVDQDRIAYLMPTSGTTGAPKIVAVSRGSLLHYASQARTKFELTDQDRVLQFASLAFDTAIEEIYPTLLAGALLIPRPSGLLDSLGGFEDFVTARGVTVLDLPTAWWKAWLEEANPWDRGAFAALRLVILGGEAVQRGSLSSWHERTGEWKDEAPRLLNTYGPTETTVVVAWSELTRADFLAEVDPPLGTPVPGARLAIRDAEGQDCLPGIPGELWVAGPSVAVGYWQDDEATAQRFVDRFDRTDGERLTRWYRTGDRVYWRSDGRLAFLGRQDRQIKIRGQRVELTGIEEILGRVKGVRDAVVSYDASAPVGARLIAWVRVAEEAEAPSEQALRQHSEAWLPPAACPERFVVVEVWPRTPGGKIDRRALAQTLPATTAAPTVVVDARTRAMIELFEELFGLEGVQPDSDFFALGGDSLLAARMATRIEKRFDRALSLASLFEARTPMGLARVLDPEAERELAAPPSLPRVELGAHYAPLTGAVQLPPRRVLITGATGFLGAHLLAELAQPQQLEVFALVRAPSVEAGRARLDAEMRRWQLNELNHAGLRVLCGDLASPGLGLSAQDRVLVAESDAILHVGASTNFALPYDQLAPINVEGTRKVLELAAEGRPKALHHVSTIGIFDLPAIEGRSVVDESTPLDACQGLVGGYAQSKWAAEQLVQAARERGLPVTIHRPGRIIGESPGAQPDDFALRLFRGCLALGLVPDLEFAVDATPAPFLARAIVALITDQDSLGEVFHLQHPTPPTTRDIRDEFRRQGHAIEVLSFAEWHREALHAARGDREHPLHGLLPLLTGLQPEVLAAGLSMQRVAIGTERTQARLRSLGLAHPSIAQMRFF